MTASRDDDLAQLIDAIAVLGYEVRDTPASPFALELSRAQMNLLFILSRTEHATVRQLADALRVTSAAVSQTLGTLREAQLITSHTDPDDGRSRVLALTETARAQVDLFQQARVHAMTTRFDPLSDVEVASAARLLERIVGRGVARG